MSNFIATVSQIQNCDTLNIVKFDFNHQTLSMMSLDLSQEIRIGTKVKLIVKPSNVSIAKDFNGKTSYSNELKSTIKSLDNGELLSSVELETFDTIFESIITLDSSQKMNLKIGDTVTALIKESDLSILEVIS